MSVPQGSLQNSGWCKNPSQLACFRVSSGQGLPNSFSRHLLSAYYVPGTTMLGPEEPQAVPDARAASPVNTCVSTHGQPYSRYQLLLRVLVVTSHFYSPPQNGRFLESEQTFEMTQPSALFTYVVISLRSRDWTAGCCGQGQHSRPPISCPVFILAVFILACLASLPSRIYSVPERVAVRRSLPCVLIQKSTILFLETQLSFVFPFLLTQNTSSSFPKMLTFCRFPSPVPAEEKTDTRSATRHWHAWETQGTDVPSC